MSKAHVRNDKRIMLWSGWQIRILLLVMFGQISRLARDSIFGKSALISGGHVDRASVRRFCVADRCWSATFRFNSALNSVFSATKLSGSWE